MNEQIQELLKQATYDVLGVKQIDQKQFSELVIENCIQILINNGYDDAAKCLHDVHFGIDDAP